MLDKCSITVGGKTPDQIKEDSAKKYLASIGFSEIITYSFISPKDYKDFDYDLNTLQAVRLKNPLGEDMSLMRTTLTPSMVAAVARNLNRKNDQGRMFELAKTYIPKALPLTELPDENASLSIALFGEDEDFFTAKGAIEGLLSHLCFAKKLSYERSKQTFLHPNRSADIFADGKYIGFVGQLHPEKCEYFGIDKPVYIAEIDYQSIKDDFTREYSVKVFSKFPQVERDLALVADDGVTHATILEAIYSTNVKTLTSVKLFDVYTGEKVKKGTKSLAYRLTFSSLEKTLDDAEIENYVRKILKKLNEIGVTLR